MVESMAQQLEIIEGWEEGMEDPHCCYILDDLGYDEDFLKSKVLRFLLMNGRHLKCPTHLVLHDATGIKPAVREQADYVFVFRQHSKSGIRKLFENYFGMFENLREFAECLNLVCDKYGVLVLDLTSDSTALEDRVFWWRADPTTPPFQMGDENFRNFRPKGASGDFEEESKLSPEAMEERRTAQRAAMSITAGMSKLNVVGQPQPAPRPAPSVNDTVRASVGFRMIKRPAAGAPAALVPPPMPDGSPAHPKAAISKTAALGPIVMIPKPVAAAPDGAVAAAPPKPILPVVVDKEELGEAKKDLNKLLKTLEKDKEKVERAAVPRSASPRSNPKSNKRHIIPDYPDDEFIDDEDLDNQEPGGSYAQRPPARKRQFRGRRGAHMDEYDD